VMDSALDLKNGALQELGSVRLEVEKIHLTETWYMVEKQAILVNGYRNAMMHRSPSDI
jgi:hypothetical protein